MRQKIGWLLFRPLSLAILFSTPEVVQALTTVTVKVTVVAPPSCVINNNKTIDVDFGTIIGPQVDGQKFKRAVDYTLECTNQTTNAMRLMIIGNPATFDASALQTNISDLGISLEINGKKIGVNNWINFDYPEKPELKAVPVKKQGSTPVGGEFQASATMMIAYQ